jgi:dTDP-glucose pyrophosphorylase
MQTSDTNLRQLLISPEATIHEALRRINATSHLMQLVVDESGRLLATVTDGDIRRALVEGAGLETQLRNCMHNDPVSALSAEDAAAQLKEYSGHIHCVPVLDSEGRPTSIVSDTPHTAVIRQALILAGGFGTRLGERTQKTPKPLLEIAGKPILDHLILDLRSQGITELYIAAHYLSEQIETYVETLPKDISAEVLIEEEPLGTAGSLSLIKDRIDGPLLVANGDIVSRTDFVALTNHHAANGRHATIGATRYKMEIPFGVLEHDDDGTVLEIVEKPSRSHFVAAGIYILEPDVYQMVGTASRTDMPVLLSRAIAKNLKVGIFPIHEYWLDLGRPEDLQLAEDEKRHWLDR